MQANSPYLSSKFLAPVKPDIREEINQGYLPWDLSAPKGCDFESEIKCWNLGKIMIADYKLGPSYGIRNGAMLEKSQDRNNFVFLELIEKGLIIGHHDHHPVELKTDDMFLWNPLGKSEYEVVDPSHKIILIMPKQIIEEKLSLFSKDISHHFITNDTCTGSLLADFLRSLLNRVRNIHSSEFEAISNVTATLIADVFQLQSENKLENQNKYILRKVCKYIYDNLGERDLSPAIIANENKISLRYLQQLFSDTGTSTSKWIKEQRLIRCRHEILRSHGKIPITSIALNFGFEDTGNFSRAFKAYFGQTPSEIKKDQLKKNNYM